MDKNPHTKEKSSKLKEQNEEQKQIFATEITDKVAKFEKDTGLRITNLKFSYVDNVLFNLAIDAKLI